MNTNSLLRPSETKHDSQALPSNFNYLSQVLSPPHSPQYSHASFPEGIYLPSSDEKTNLNNLIRYKFDNTYHHALKEIDWNVFLTLKFRKRGFTGQSNSASWKRKHYLWDLGHEVIGELDLSSNGLQYFWAEETNSEKQAHYHVLFHRVYSEKCSVEDFRRSIERNLDPKIVQIPKAKNRQEPAHVQTVRSQDRVARYILKIPLFQKEEKVVGYSHKFVRFWNRHWNWTRKQVA